jgi:hypothetical protein
MKCLLSLRMCTVRLGLFTMISLLIGCGGGDSASVVSIPANLALRSLAEPAGNNCATGGKQLLVGPDANSDGVLQDSEMSQSFFVCNGVLGATGAQGATGTLGAIGPAGSAGSVGPTGSQGPTGPQGPTASSTGTPGPTGSQGAAGAQGPAGPVGSGGPVGATGSSATLVQISTTACPFGVGYQLTIPPTTPTGTSTVASFCREPLIIP